MILLYCFYVMFSLGIGIGAGNELCDDTTILLKIFISLMVFMFWPIAFGYALYEKILT